jgi:hypothetical protein
MDPKFVIYQATLWDRVARLTPIAIILLTGILYTLGFRNWDLIIDTLMGLALLFFVTWWFWVIYTIMLIAEVLEKSKVNLKDIIQEVKSVKEDLKHLID